MKRIIFSLISAVALGFFSSCGKPGPSPNPTPSPALALNTPSPSSVTPTETPEPRQYVIEDLKGSALIFEEGSTQGEKAEEEEVVESGDEIITKTNSDMTLTLDENTMVHIPANSDVKVDQLMPNSSKGFISRLKLVEGKVQCEVERLQETQSSFEVSAGGVICGVRGTAFEVQKQGQSVHTNTFHGVVEMKKGDRIEQVSANQHLAFSLNQGAFAPLRPLKPEEKGHYKTWVRKQEVVRQKQSQRMAVLHSIANLPPEDQAQLFRDVSKAKPKDRVKKMRQLLQKTYVPETRPQLKHQNLTRNHEIFSRQNQKENTRRAGVSTKSQKNHQANERPHPAKQKERGSRPGIRNNALSLKPVQPGRTQTHSRPNRSLPPKKIPQSPQQKPKISAAVKPTLKKPQASHPKQPVARKGKIPNPKESKKTKKPSEK